MGITRFGDEPCEVDPWLARLLSSIEYRIAAAPDIVSRIAEGSPCIAHAPDPEEEECPFCHDPDGSRSASAFTRENACRNLRDASSQLRSAGKVLLIESTYESTSMLARIVDQVPEAGFTLDARYGIIYWKGLTRKIRAIPPRGTVTLECMPEAVWVEKWLSDRNSAKVEKGL